ncbi:MAG: hypothetical protein IPK97_04420 [Ahniella sp.]|nr:hypothetical protein [Ahniella sp.]
MSGDLDAIVMRALRKEPDARYATVNDSPTTYRRSWRIGPWRRVAAIGGIEWHGSFKGMLWRFGLSGADWCP